MGPTWVRSTPDGPHVGLMNLAIRDILLTCDFNHLLTLKWHRSWNHPPERHGFHILHNDDWFIESFDFALLSQILYKKYLNNKGICIYMSGIQYWYFKHIFYLGCLQWPFVELRIEGQSPKRPQETLASITAKVLGFDHIFRVNENS